MLFATRFLAHRRRSWFRWGLALFAPSTMLAPSDTPARLSLEKSAVEKGLLRVALLFCPIASFAPVTPFLLLCNISFLNLLGLLTETFPSQIRRSPHVGLVLVADAAQRKRRAGGARRGAGGMSQEPRPSGSREAHGCRARVSGFARNGTAIVPVNGGGGGGGGVVFSCFSDRFFFGFVFCVYKQNNIDSNTKIL